MPVQTPGFGSLLESMNLLTDFQKRSSPPIWPYEYRMLISTVARQLFPDFLPRELPVTLLKQPAPPHYKEAPVDNAETAGTPTSDESSTNTIEKDFTYAFLLSKRETSLEPYLVVDISIMFGPERHKRDAVAALTAKSDELLQEKLDHIAYMVQTLKRDGMMSGPFMIRTKEPLAWGDLHEYVNSLDEAGCTKFMQDTYVSLKMLEFEL